jgi:hypothetical protein
MHLAIRTSALVALLTVITLPLAPGNAFSGSQDATIGFYLADASGQCRDLDPPSCATEDIQVSGELGVPYYAVLCVFNADPDSGVVGISCGIRYDGASTSGVDVWGWTRCADGLEFPSDSPRWPDSGSGSRITWLECQKETPDGFNGGVTAVVGFFYVTVYSPDRMEVISNNHLESGPELRIARCDTNPDGELIGVEVAIPPEQVGFLEFSEGASEKGSLPCIQVIREDATWGQIKSLYDNR